MINIQNVTHAYHKKQVLNDVQLHVREQERCALVGQNGAGKSTLIHLMLGIFPLKQGRITLGGHDNKKQLWKKNLSYLPEKFHLYPHLTGMENMMFFASLGEKGICQEQIKQVLKAVSLWENRHVPIRDYSKGMLQRLGLGVILYDDNDILILDEPTSGLDPLGREEILGLLQSLQHKTILMASHHFHEIEQICTHVAYLEQGTITKYTVADFSKLFMRGGKQ